MLKRIGIGVLIIVIFVMMLWFTSNNPGHVAIDLAFGVVEPSIPLAFSVTFVIGWAFGLLCTAIFMFRISQRATTTAPCASAIQSPRSQASRNLPLADAD